MTRTVEDAFAEWRLAHPGEHGWPLEAFKAGWSARSEQTAAEGDNLMIGTDRCGSRLTVVLMRRNESDIIEVLAEKTFELPI